MRNLIPGKYYRFKIYKKNIVIKVLYCSQHFREFESWLVLYHEVNNSEVIRITMVGEPRHFQEVIT